MKRKNYNQLNQSILQTLQDIKILDRKKIEYLVMGSLICAATRGKFYRYVDDVDLICDLKDKYRIKKLLEGIGYKAEFEKPKWRLGFYWLDLRHKKDKRKHIAVIFGNFDKRGGWRMSLNKGFSLYLPPPAVKATNYSLREVNFVGFPRESAYIALTTMPLLYDAPKRKPDFEILKNKVDEKIVNKIYKEKVGLWWSNFYLPNWTILKTLAFFKNLIFGRDCPV
jgi:hypothetical protein